MRIDTTGRKEYRTDLYEWAGDVFGEATKAKAIDAACRHAHQDFENKQKAMQYIETHCSGEVARELAEILSTNPMPIHYEFSTSVGVEEGDR